VREYYLPTVCMDHLRGSLVCIVAFGAPKCYIHTNCYTYRMLGVLFVHVAGESRLVGVVFAEAVWRGHANACNTTSSDAEVGSCRPGLRSLVGCAGSEAVYASSQQR
jgi:hypothetical protein